jgi:hypothetical protein
MRMSASERKRKDVWRGKLVGYIPRALRSTDGDCIAKGWVTGSRRLACVLGRSEERQG